MIRALFRGKKITGDEDFNYFMTIVYPDDNLRIMDYNRVLRDLNGLSPTELISRMETDFLVTETTPYTKPALKHTMVLLIEGRWYLCETKP